VTEHLVGPSDADGQWKDRLRLANFWDSLPFLA
jgi:hypothetical protein